jgi:hypothetical protein
MFHVLVIGGMSLVACGGVEATGPRDSGGGDSRAPDANAGDGNDAIVFPSETNAAPYDASVSLPDAVVTTSSVDASVDTAVSSDALDDAADASEDHYFFPIEGPPK